MGKTSKKTTVFSQRKSLTLERCASQCVHWGKPPHTIDFTLFGVLDGQYLLRPILVYKP